tara:strand:- start:1220 stop:2536 length:1317 start_codon:yes stop_codon:yes gene_type:complete
LTDSSINYNFPADFPTELKLLLLDRKDLLNKGFHKIENERKLVIWIILHGVKEYKKLLNSKDDNNKVIKWLSEYSSDKKYKSLPKVILGLWDLNKSIRRRFPNPNEDKNFSEWIKNEFNNFNIDIPSYSNFFPNHEENSTFGYFKHKFSNIIWFFKLIFTYVYLPKRIIDNNLSGIPVAGNLNGFQIQRNVISALVYRELKTRVSEVKFGVFGVFIEPLGVLGVFLVIFSLLRGRRADLDIELFLISGIVLYTLFSEIALRSMNAIRANEALFFYRPVKPIDTVIARTIVESHLYGIVFFVIVGFIFLYKEEWILQDFFLLLSSYLALVIFAFGLGINLMIAGHKFPVLHQFLPIIIRPVWFISGVFFGVSRIPYSIRPWISWSPILQAIELTRHSFSTNYYIPTDVISLSYLWTFAIILTTWGLFIYLRSERFLLTK